MDDPRAPAANHGVSDARSFFDAPVLFDTLFLRHPAPMWVFDPATFRFLFVNDAAVDLYGFSREEFAGMTIFDIRPQSEHARIAQSVKSGMHRGKAGRWRHRKKNGEFLDVLTVGHDVRLAAADAVLAIVTDLSEVGEAQRRASETRSMLDSIVAHLPLGVFVKDMADDARYILYNEACGIIVGKDASRIVGQTDIAVFGPEQGAEFRRQDFSVFGAGQTIAVEETIPRPDGEQRLVRTVKLALPPIGGAAPRYLLGLADDVTERRSYQARIAHIAMHDALTGLPNRGFFADHVKKLFADDRPLPFALFLIDVDHFKLVNDSMGHPAGDALLREVGSRLDGLADPGGIVARLGGDEFALVVAMPPGGVEWTAIDHAQRIMAAFVEPFRLEGACEHVAASVGVAIAPEHGKDVDTLFRNADLALYASKADGGSTFRFYESAFRREAENRHALTVELRRALSENEFELFFQPILCLKTDSVSGFEALIRWRHPERGLLAPGAFIAVAEETGLITAIGEWVIRSACETAASWPNDLSVAVNLSSLQFKHVGLLADVVSALDETGLRPARLELEITESVLLSDSRQNLQILHALRDLGIRIAMDDFGTGYSSLSNLRSFPFSKIKMDRSFTAGIETDPGSLAIARAVMGLGSGFNLVTTAEGVETAEQLARLRAEEFSEAQGYLIAKPMPAGAVAAFLAGRGQAGAWTAHTASAA